MRKEDEEEEGRSDNERLVVEGIAGAEFQVIPATGHLPQYEAPDGFRAVLFDWMRRGDQSALTDRS